MIKGYFFSRTGVILKIPSRIVNSVNVKIHWSSHFGGHVYWDMIYIKEKVEPTKTILLLMWPIIIFIKYPYLINSWKINFWDNKIYVPGLVLGIRLCTMKVQIRTPHNIPFEVGEASLTCEQWMHPWGTSKDHWLS